MLSVLYWIVIGGLAGWIAEKVMKSDMGLIGNIGLGIAGSVVANAILGVLNIVPSGGWIPQLIVAVVGACALIYGWRIIQSRR